MTKDVINLNRARKTRARTEAKAEADANAVKHGRTKAQRLLEATRSEKARQMLDRHKTDEE